MEIARLRAQLPPDIRPSDLVGTGQHFEVQDEDVARLLFSDGSYYGDVCSYTACEHYMLSLHELESQFAIWIACAGEAQDFLTLVQLWLIAATRLGFNSMSTGVFKKYDHFMTILEFSTSCIAQCNILAAYQILSHRHNMLEKARIELTMEVLRVSAQCGGEQKCDTMFCGFHQSFSCPNDETFSRDWQISIGGGAVYDDLSWRQFASPLFFRDMQAEACVQYDVVEGRYLEPAIQIKGSAPRRVGPSDIYWNFREGLCGLGVARDELKVQMCCYNCARDVASNLRKLHN
jgi:hypothetical protein